MQSFGNGIMLFESFFYSSLSCQRSTFATGGNFWAGFFLDVAELVAEID